MKINVKKIAIVGGSLAVLYYLISAYALGGKSGVKKILGKKTKPKEVVKPKGVKPPKKEFPSKPTPIYAIPQSSGGGTGGMVTNNQTVPQNYNPRDYGDIVLGSVDRGGNIRR
jgi:hypothetical protein|eukprot:SAG31_NODE_355_length_17187_cov_15.601299_28_plen_113_part_00